MSVTSVRSVSNVRSAVYFYTRIRRDLFPTSIVLVLEASANLASNCKLRKRRRPFSEPVAAAAAATFARASVSVRTCLGGYANNWCFYLLNTSLYLHFVVKGGDLGYSDEERSPMRGGGGWAANNR